MLRSGKKVYHATTTHKRRGREAGIYHVEPFTEVRRVIQDCEATMERPVPDREYWYPWTDSKSTGL